MKRSGKEIAVRMVALAMGLTIAHLGVTLFLLSDLGADPFNVLIQGLFRSLSKPLPILTHGYTHMAVSLLIIGVLLVVDRSYIKLGTVFCMFCGGPIIDFFTWMLSPIINAESPFIMRVLVLTAGCVILAYGMTIVMKSDMGVGPNDLVAIVISDKIHKPFGTIRIIVDLSFVVIGFFLGGAVGIGTIICAFVVGPVAGIFLPFNEKLVEGMVKKLS